MTSSPPHFHTTPHPHRWGTRSALEWYAQEHDKRFHRCACVGAQTSRSPRSAQTVKYERHRIHSIIMPASCVSDGPCDAPQLRAATAAPPLVVFNRVPKCGSTSLEAAIKREASAGRFVFERSSNFVNNSLSASDQQRLAEEVTGMGRRHRTLYDRHVLYIDFFALRLPRPVYINLIRDPISMQVSAFYFWRQCVCVTKQPFCDEVRRPRGSRAMGLCSPSYTIDAVYAAIATPKATVGLMTRWFCGQGASCATDRRAALRQARKNLRDEYTWVGILERFEESLVLLARLIPAYFGGMDIRRAAREHIRPRARSGGRGAAAAAAYDPPNNATLHKLHMENANDAQLYRFAVELLDCRLRRCAAGARWPPPPPPSRHEVQRTWRRQHHSPAGATETTVTARPPSPLPFKIRPNAAADMVLRLGRKNA